MNKITLAILALILIAGCTSNAYQSQPTNTVPTQPVRTTNFGNDEVDYVTHSTSQFTMTYPDKWFEPKHYTRDYYFFQLTAFIPWIHVSVFDIDEFTNTTDYYETISELFVWVFDFQEIDHYVTEDTMIIRGTMIDEEDDELIVTYKVVVCGNTALALDISGLTEEYSETKDMIDKTIESFKCV